MTVNEIHRAPVGAISTRKSDDPSLTFLILREMEAASNDEDCQEYTSGCGPDDSLNLCDFASLPWKRFS